MLGQIREIAFELGGKTLVLDVSEAGQQWADLVDFNTVSRIASVDVTESGMVPLTIEQYESIINADTVAVQIRGSKNTATYEAEHIADSFLPNLRSFYDAHLRR